MKSVLCLLLAISSASVFADPPLLCEGPALRAANQVRRSSEVESVRGASHLVEALAWTDRQGSKVISANYSNVANGEIIAGYEVKFNIVDGKCDIWSVEKLITLKRETL